MCLKKDAPRNASKIELKVDRNMAISTTLHLYKIIMENAINVYQCYKAEKKQKTKIKMINTKNVLR